MQKKLIFVAGYCATGKTAFSIRLAERLNIPCFNKDFIKEAIGADFDYENIEVNRKLSKAAFNMLEHIVDRSLVSSTPVILESNFKTDEAERLKVLINRHACNTLTYLFLGDLRIIHRRFMDREISPERHPIHKSHKFDRFEDFEEIISPLRDFTIGGREVVVDATSFDCVDFELLFEHAEGFLL